MESSMMIMETILTISLLGKKMFKMLPTQNVLRYLPPTRPENAWWNIGFIFRNSNTDPNSKAVVFIFRLVVLTFC